MSDDGLREKVRELIRTGRLPARSPERVWGGSGLCGLHCALCGAAIRREEVALELEVRGAGGVTYPQLHVACLSLFEETLRDLEAATASGRPGDRNAA